MKFKGVLDLIISFECQIFDKVYRIWPFMKGDLQTGSIVHRFEPTKVINFNSDINIFLTLTFSYELTMRQK